MQITPELVLCSPYPLSWERCKHNKDCALTEAGDCVSCTDERLETVYHEGIQLAACGLKLAGFRLRSVEAERMYEDYCANCSACEIDGSECEICELWNQEKEICECSCRYIAHWEILFRFERPYSKQMFEGLSHKFTRDIVDYGFYSASAEDVPVLGLIYTLTYDISPDTIKAMNMTQDEAKKYEKDEEAVLAGRVLPKALTQANKLLMDWLLLAEERGCFAVWKLAGYFD